MKVLFVSYFSPPAGGVPVRRLVSLLKHLTKYGAREVLLTSKNPRYYAFEREDKILECISIFRIDEILSIRKKRGDVQTVSQIIENNLLINILRFFYNLIRYPDPQWLWIPTAVREGIKIIRKEKPDVIIATQPPTTNLIVGYLISQSTGIPLILDYRDFWAVEPYIKRINPYHPLIDKYLERRIINRAVQIWCVTIPMKHQLIKRFSQYREKFFYIPNGYDEDDFRGKKRTRRNDGVIRFIHTGPITTIRNPELFLKAMSDVIKDHIIDKRIEFHQFGFVHPRYQKLFVNYEDFTIVHNHIEHKNVIEEIVNSDIGVCIAGRFSSDIVGFPHKAYEYLRGGLPVLAIAPFNENYRWLIKHNMGWQAEPDNLDSIKEAIIKAINQGVEIEREVISGFEWGNISKYAYQAIKKINRR
ncbi:MAG: glycosyltransferase [bacterium]